MSYAPDPGGVFASDVHRRVMCAAANPGDPALSVDEIMARVERDDHLDIDRDELAEALADLEADGHLGQKDGGWRNTASGWEALTNEKANAEAAA